MDVGKADSGLRQPNAKDLLAELGTAAGREDPYPVYARLRATAPVYYQAGTAYLTRYDDCAMVVRNGSMRAQSAAWMDTVRPGWREHPGLRATHESFVFCDPPDHTRLRRLVSGPFTQHRVHDLSGFLTTVTDSVLAAASDMGADGGVVDLHELLAASLPIRVIGKIIGVPEADQPLLREPLEGLRLAVDGAGASGSLPTIDASAEALIDYFAGLVAQRRADPREDLVTALAGVVDSGADRDGGGGPVLTEDELLQTLVLIFSAAIESMVDLLLNGTAALLAHPDQATRLRSDPGLADRAVEEALRYDAPVQAIGRITATAMTIGGIEIPAGILVLPMLGAANRDPEQFARPGTYDLSRAGAPALSFGGGIHRCLGAALGRMEAAVFLPALLTRFPQLRLAGPLVRRGFVLRGFAHFPVTIR